ncbi:MAG: hypothetical protein IJ587_04890 [Synergistaceae bacterium]|nr:hypothetical protein [Synergistaceae bacterium]
MNEFTRGKWKYFDDLQCVGVINDGDITEIEIDIFAQDGNYDCIADINCHSGYSKEEINANGRLIAAAPEMYQHLKLILNGELSSDDVEQLLARIDGEEANNE